ncbi:MAG: hypothetical protein RR346_10015 [Bacteroidales bacterium]
MKKIMFNDRFGLTEAVLNGSKTQTRRAFTPFSQKLIEDCILKGYILGYKDGILMATDSGYKLMADDFRQAYKVGEVVAVAQSYDSIVDKHGTVYAEAYDVPDRGAGYFNKMFVCADLMPHQIRITNVRIERLQDISEEDCIKEGAGLYGPNENGFSRYNAVTAKKTFPVLIDYISGKGTWDSNPFVWVYDFELIK